MRRHPPRRLAVLVAAAALAAGCQEYEFNAVGRCVIQPGSERVTLSSVSSADVLFVVDDSGSMGGKQAKLAAAFDAFITSLDAYNGARVQNGLEPFAFHIAITTTSVFYNPPGAATCQASCGSAANVCCDGTSTPLLIAKACPAGNECGAGFTCRTSCVDHAGEAVCCDGAGQVERATVPCTTPGAACGNLQQRYVFPRAPVACGGATQTCDTAGGYGCVSGCGGLTGSFCCNAGGALQLTLGCAPGNAVEGAPYPHGAFVGLGTNPRVLHFDRQLYGQLSGGSWTPVDPTTARSGQGFTRQQLAEFFKANVNVGTCGSGEEQGLQAGRLAIAKALRGVQLDTRDAAGAVAPGAGVVADWPHADAKLVVVYIGDEDDCSSPEDPARGVVLTGPPGGDACVADAALPLDAQKEFRVEDVVSDLQALNRPLGAAFVVSTAETSCLDDACTPGLCCDYVCTGSQSVCRDATCGGQAAGARFLAAAGALRRGGADVVAGSICDPGDPPYPPGTGFAPILIRIAEIVKPPSALLLPTQPADSAVTLLRIVRADGTTRKRCTGPARPPLTFQEARAQGFDWWFTATRDQYTDALKQPAAASRFVFINHESGHCEASPGETYSADYLGLVPAGGCTSDADCAAALGGGATQWVCFVGLDAAGRCVQPSASLPGTCLCGGADTVCPNGR